MLEKKFKTREALHVLQKKLIDSKEISRETVAQATGALSSNQLDEVIRAVKEDYQRHIHLAQAGSAGADTAGYPSDGLPDFIGDFYGPVEANISEGAARILRDYDRLISFLQALKGEREKAS